MDTTELLILATICLAGGIFCYLKPEKLKWMPVYIFYEKIAGEKTALMIVQASAGLGLGTFSIILYIKAFGVI